MPRADLRDVRLLRWGAWAPVVIWAGVIWHLGTDGWSASETSRWISPLIHWLLPDLSAAQLDAAVLGVRKLAHPGVYGLLAGLCLHALQRGTRWPFGPVAVATLLCVTVLASADETRQTHSAVRTGAAGDVVLDAAGALVVLALAFAAERALRRRLFAAI
jgi:VanZ family protein